MYSENGEDGTTEEYPYPHPLGLIATLTSHEFLAQLEEDNTPLSVYNPLTGGSINLYYDGMQVHTPHSGRDMVAPYQHSFVSPGSSAPAFHWSKARDGAVSFTGSDIVAIGRLPHYFISFLLDHRGRLVLVVEMTAVGWVESVRVELLRSVQKGSWDFRSDHDDDPPSPFPTLIAF